MKLYDACEIGYACGCSTIKEALLNIEIHCSNIFTYEDATLELYELHEEAKHYNESAYILDVFPEIIREEDAC